MGQAAKPLHESAESRPQLRRRSLSFFLGLAVLAALKLWLVHHHEVAACDYPHDDPWYVFASAHEYWGGSYGKDGFIRPPAYPLWIAAVRNTGLPLRVATELLFLGAATAFARSLLSAGLSPIATFVVAALVICHPFSVLLNDSVAPDALYAPVLLFAVAGMIVLLDRTSAPLACLTGLAFAILWYTRQESALIFGYVGLFALLAWVIRVRLGKRVRDAAQEVGPMLAIIAGVIAVVVIGVRSMNYLSFGAFADHELAMRGFQAAYRALLRITPEPPRRYVPVPKEVLRKAFAASPTLVKLRPYFDGPEGRRWESLSTAGRSPEGEIGGIFVWALRAAIQWAGHATTATEAETFCRKVAEEIDSACKTGALRCRSLLAGPLDPNLPSYLAELPGAFLRISSLLFWTGDSFEARCASFPVRPWIVEAFDTAANRRASLITRVIHLGGWAADPSDPVRLVSFRDAAGTILGITDQIHERPDLDAWVRETTGRDVGPLPAAFDLRIPVPTDHQVDGVLIFTLRSGRTIAIPWEKVSAVPLATLFKAGDGGALTYAIEAREVPTDRRGLEDRALSFLLQTYGKAVIALTVAGLLAPLFLIVSTPHSRSQRVLAGVTVLLLGTAATRVALFTAFDASFWPGDDPRFVFPIAYLVPCSMWVAVAIAIERVTGRRRALP
jgi:hypothetical protein